jgi:glycosyltransferase involved in cell wall biosynthesis
VPNGDCIGAIVKIVIGTNGLGFGGAEAAIVTVANELARRSHDVTIWTLRTGQPIQRIDDFDARVAIQQLAFDSFKSPTSIRDLQRAVADARPDAALYIANPVAAGVHALVDSAPVFYWVQNYIRPRRIRWYEAAARVAGAQLVVLNDAVGTSVIGGCRTVVPNPMPPSEAGGIPAPPAWREGRLLTVGRIVPQKDHEFLLRVVASLRASGYPVQLDVVGDGGLLDDVVASAERREVTEAVVFHGGAPSTPWFARRPFVVMTSHWEGHSVVLMEAASHGCPVVARDAPGVRDCLGSDYEGLTPHDSPEAMAATIGAWIDDPRATAERADRLRERMTQWYSTTTVVDAWEHLFRERSSRRLDRLRRRAPDGSRQREVV